MREFFVSNSIYWITEFHLDGFRFDATQAIVDTSGHHVLAEITRASRQAAPGRSLYLINENEPQNTRLVRPLDSGGYGMDALWNDDFHHSAIVALSGRAEAYYLDHPAVHRSSSPLQSGAICIRVSVMPGISDAADRRPWICRRHRLFTSCKITIRSPTAVAALAYTRLPRQGSSRR